MLLEYPWLNETGLEGAAELFLQYCRIECGLARNSLAAYERDLRAFALFLGVERGVDEVEGHDISSYIGWMADRGLSPESRTRMFISLRCFFRFCCNESIIFEDPTRFALCPKVWRHLPHDLSPAEVTRLLSAECGGDVHSIRNRAILEVFYATGARVSEVCDLKISDLDLDGRTIRLFGKGSKQRMTPLGVSSVQAVERYLESARTKLAKRNKVVLDAGWLFLSRTGRRLLRESVFRVVKSAALRAGIGKNVYPHLLRQKPSVR